MSGKVELQQITKQSSFNADDLKNAPDEAIDEKNVKIDVVQTDTKKEKQASTGTEKQEETAPLKQQINEKQIQPERKFMRSGERQGTTPRKSVIQPPPPQVRSKFFVILQVVNICLGSLLFGFNLSAFNTVAGVIRHFNGWKTDTEWALYNGLITSAFPLGGIFGPILIPIMLRRMHKHVKKIMIMIDILTIASAVCEISTERPVNLIVGRFFMGVAMSMNTATIPTYIREFSPKELTGLLGSLNQLGVSLGVFVALLFGFLLPSFQELEKDTGYDNEVNWRIVLGFPIILSFVRGFFLLTVFTEEIPSVLIEEHHEDELIHYFHHLYNDKDWPIVLKEMEAEIAKEHIHEANVHDHHEIDEVFDPFKSSYRRRWWLAMIMAAGTQATGVNALLFFSNTIYKTYDPERASDYSKIMGGASFVFNFFFTLVGSKFGRRTWMLFGMGIDILSLFAFLIFNELKIWEGIFASIIVFFFGFQISLGPVAWLYLPEIIDHDGIANYSVSRWIFTLAVGLATPYMIVGMTSGGTFGLYGALLCLVFIYFLFEFKETQNQTKDQVALQFCKPSQVPPEYGESYVKLNHMKYKDYIYQFKMNEFKQQLLENGIYLQPADSSEKA